MHIVVTVDAPTWMGEPRQKYTLDNLYIKKKTNKNIYTYTYNATSRTLLGLQCVSRLLVVAFFFAESPHIIFLSET